MGLSLHGVLLEHFICVAFQVVSQRLKRNLQIVIERAFKSLSVVKGRPACPKMTHIVHVSVGYQRIQKILSPMQITSAGRAQGKWQQRGSRFPIESVMWPPRQ